MPVTSSRHRRAFITLPERLYRGVPQWVPPLRIERRAFLNPRTNPFFDHASVRLFLAVDGAGRPLGRIAAIVNRRHLDVHRDGAGFFGLFECENNPAVAAALFDAVAGFLREHGISVMRGPANMSVNDDIGLLTSGFDLAPSLMMPYNPPYYVDLVMGNGFVPAARLLAYRLTAPGGTLPERLTKGVELARRRYGFTVRPIDKRRLDADMAKIHEVYSEAWSENWGAVPMSAREFAHLAGLFKLFGDPGFCLLAEMDGAVVGFSLALPDLNQALIRLDGRLTPWGLAKLLWYRRRIDAVRLLAMGVRKPYRAMGIDVCLYHETVVRGLARNYRSMEASWILESNIAMTRVMERFGARVSQTYQVYDCPLDPAYRRAGAPFQPPVQGGQETPPWPISPNSSTDSPTSSPTP